MNTQLPLETIALLASHPEPEIRDLLNRYLNDPYLSFCPRPDDPENFDEQTGFVFDHFDGLSVLLGGNACIAADSLIYDPITKKETAVSEIKKPFHVEAFDQRTGRKVIGRAKVPFKKGTAQLYRIRLSNGKEFEATGKHRLLTLNGWQTVSDMSDGVYLLGYPQDVPHCSDTVSNSQGGYLKDRRFCDELLLSGSDNVPTPFPLQGDVHEHNHQQSHGDDLDSKCKHNLGQLPCRLSNLNSFPQFVPHRDAFESYAFQILPEHSCQTDLDAARFHWNSDHLLHTNDASVQSANQLLEPHNGFENCTVDTLLKSDLLTCPDGFQFLSKSDHLLHTNDASGQLDNQVVFSVPSNVPPYVIIESITPTTISEFWDFEVEEYHNYFFQGVVHHNSGKTQAACYKLARFLYEVSPPVDLTKFLVVSETMEQVCTIWQEKLSSLIKKEHVQKIDWYKQSANWPNFVILVPSENGNRWMIQFKSFQQGAKSFSGVSQVVGFFCDENCPYSILTEIWRGCREYNIHGSKFWTQTPLFPAPELEDIFNDKEADPSSHPEIRFYRLNTDKNLTLQDRKWLDATPSDMKECRRIGAFTSMEGAIFKDFDKRVHTCNPFPIDPNSKFYLSMDWGVRHPCACLWIAMQPDGTSVVYDELAMTEMTVKDIVKTIKARNEFHFGKLNYQVLCDPEDARARLELSALGISSTGYRKEPVWLAIDVVKRLLMKGENGRPPLLIFNNCEGLIKQMKNYRWAPQSKKPNARLAPQEPVKRDDDFVDALKGWAYTTCPDKQLRPWETVKPKVNKSLLKW